MKYLETRKYKMITTISQKGSPAQSSGKFVKNLILNVFFRKNTTLFRTTKTISPYIALIFHVLSSQVLHPLIHLLLRHAEII